MKRVLKMKNKKIKYFAVAALLIIALTGTLTAYLKDSDGIYNLFKIGQVKVNINEGDFEQMQVISPGVKIEKAPKVKNGGTVDEYVFAMVSVPLMNISVLDDVTLPPGDESASDNTKKIQSIFEVGVDSAK